MKRCPECRRDYLDETLSYCLDDGTPLLEGPRTDEMHTAILTDRSVADARTRLYDEPRDSREEPGAQTVAPGSAPTTRRWLIPLGAILLLIAAGVGVYMFVLSKNATGTALAPLQDMKFTKIPVSGDVTSAVISPDGRFIARVVREATGNAIHLRQLSGTVDSQIVPPSDVDFNGGPIFSHDSNNIYYVANETNRGFGRLFRVSLLGGEPQKIIDNVDSGITLSPDGKRIGFRRRVPETREDLLIVANEDGSGEHVVARWQQPNRLVQPIWSPNGEVFASLVGVRDEDGEYSRLDSTSVSDGTTKPISSTKWTYVSSLRWMPDSRGILVTGKPRTAETEDRGQIWYVPFPEGEPVRVTNDPNGYAGISTTSDARTALVMQWDLASNIWVIPAGDFARGRQVTSGNSEISEIAWTPDGRIVYSWQAGRFLDLWMMNADGTGNRQLTFTVDRSEYQPAVSPDGRRIAFMINAAGLFTIGLIDIAGGSATEIARNVNQFASPEFSPDSQSLYYNAVDEAGEMAFWKIPVSGGQPAKVREKMPCRPSPDANWFLCVPAPRGSNEPLKALVFPATGGDAVKTLDWPPKANFMSWSRDGKAVEYIAERDGVANVFRLSLDNGKEQKLTDWQTHSPLWHFAGSQDDRWLAVTRDTLRSELILIQNFR